MRKRGKLEDKSPNIPTTPLRTFPSAENAAENKNVPIQIRGKKLGYPGQKRTARLLHSLSPFPPFFSIYLTRNRFNKGAVKMV